MQTFHYALRPGGYLFLGQSESVTRKTKLFGTLDKKHGIVQRRETSAVAPGFLLALPLTAKAEPAPARGPARMTDPVEAEIRRVMEKHSPAYVVIDRHHEILRFSGGEAKRYLDPSPGTASLSRV